jgi:hypothetical protein
MRFKQYMEYVAKHIPADSEKPSDVVQALACLIATRLSNSGKLPIACGKGNDLDMDIVQAGLLAGLEKLSKYDASKGTLKQFLYADMAGIMLNYAWERENRVSDSRPKDWPDVCGVDYGAEEIMPAQLVDTRSTEAQMIAEEDSQTAREAISAAIDNMSAEDIGMLMRDAKIGYNAALRQAWAAEIGVTVGALSMKLSRLRKRAREWALTVQ